MRNMLATMRKYRFLLNQLVSREFKTRYKRSVLGVLWSMLNPLLTMCVQYLVFSNLFRFNIEHYAVYLLVGSVVFNFFSDATQSALLSITNSAPLITKVYIPTYVFPVAKVISACINLLFSTAALYLIIFLNGVAVSWTHLLIPVLYVCLIGFSIGIGLALSAAMVYFRDIQFLYGVVITLWMYLTPLFYDISIIPERYRGVYKLNPMYHYVTFMRTLVLDAKVPSLGEFMWVSLCALGSLAVGLLIFRKAKRNFILYI